MAGETKTPTLGALSGSFDPNKFPVYDRAEGAQEEYNQGIEKMIKSLEQRYAQPNWFKVASGFLKPQLGGFAASLGSASEALGENVEQQRAMELPIAELRAKLAQSKAVMGQNVAVADEIKQWHKDNPNQVPPPGLVSHWLAKAPDLPAAKSLGAQQELSMKQQQLLSTQQATELKLLSELRTEGKITPQEYQSRLLELRSRLSGIPSFPNAPSTPGSATSSTTSTTPTPVETGAPAEATNTAQPPAASAPAAPATKPPTPQQDFENFQIKPTYTSSMLHDRPVTAKEQADNAQVLKNAALLEDEKAAQWKGLQRVMNPTNYATANKANEAGLKMMKNEPDTVAEISELLRQKGPIANLLAGGVGVHVGPYGASFSLQGLAPALVSGLKQEKRNAYDKLLNALAKSTYYDLLSRGIDPEKEGAEKFGQRMLQEANIGQGSEAIHRAFAENDVRLRHNKNVYKALTKLYPKATATGSLTPLHDLYSQHPEMRVLDKMLEMKLGEIQ